MYASNFHLWLHEIMKGRIVRPLALVLLLCQLLTSCYSYRSVISSSAATTLALQVTPGKTYLIELKSGEEKRMKVLQVDEKNLYGTYYTDNPNGRTLESPDTILPQDQIADVKEKQAYNLLTVVAVVVPLGLLVIIASTTTYFENFTWNF